VQLPQRLFAVRHEIALIDREGGRNAGIPTCLYGRTEPISPLCDYAVADLLELPALLAPL